MVSECEVRGGEWFKGVGLGEVKKIVGGEISRFNFWRGFLIG